MKKRIALIAILFVAIIGVIAWLASKEQKDESAKKTLVASFYPIYEFASQVAGEQMHVVNISGNNVSPHDFEPSAKDIVQIEQADLFIFNGAGLDPWAERLEETLTERGVNFLELASVIDLRDATGIHEDDHDEDEEEALEGGNTHDHGDKDPHFWVDPVNAKQEVLAIRDALIAVDPDHKATYTENAGRYAAQLDALHQDIQNGLSSCTKDTIVVSHDAFRYFADRYALEAVSIAGLSPTNEPSAQQIADIATIVNEQGITHIFFETLVSPRLSETLASETNTKTLVLDPVAGVSEDRQANGESYLSVMRQNLVNLQEALQCQNN